MELNSCCPARVERCTAEAECPLAKLSFHFQHSSEEKELYISLCDRVCTYVCLLGVLPASPEIHNGLNVIETL